MKKERNCGNTNYPVYPMMQQGMPMMQNIGMMPSMEMMPNMGMMQGMNTSNLTNHNDEIQRLEQRINMLERRVTTLEASGNTSNSYNSYNSSGYQML